METKKAHTSEMIVDDTNTAIACKSGELPVLATPAMIALMENAAMKAVEDILPEGCTTVGGSVNVTHLRPTAIGHTVTAVAEL